MERWTPGDFALKTVEDAFWIKMFKEEKKIKQERLAREIKGEGEKQGES